MTEQEKRAETTATCGICGADLTEKSDEWVVVTPGGAWCSHHVKSAPP